jgi:Outer membrane protein beta-barrel domain
MTAIAKLASSIVVAGAAIAIANQSASAQTNWYLGGGASTVSVDTGGNGDINLGLVQGRAGFQALGVLALEGEVGFGVDSDDLPIVTFAPGPIDTGVESEFGAFAVARLPLDQINLFARAGYAQFNFDNRTLGSSGANDGSGPAYGVGADIQLLSVRGRLDYTHYEFDEGDADGWGLSLLWLF